jgi:hypothetical protein
MAEFTTWKTSVGKLLTAVEIDPRAIRHRDWRQAFIESLTPAQAAERIAAGYLNRLSAKARLKYLGIGKTKGYP